MAGLCVRIRNQGSQRLPLKNSYTMCKRYAKNFCFAFIMILTYLFSILLHLTTLSSNPTSDCSRRPTTRPTTSFEPDLDCCVRPIYSETMSESTTVVALALPDEDEQEQEGGGEDYIYIST